MTMLYTGCIVLLLAIAPPTIHSRAMDMDRNSKEYQGDDSMERVEELADHHGRGGC